MSYDEHVFFVRREMEDWFYVQAGNLSFHLLGLGFFNVRQARKKVLEALEEDALKKAELKAKLEAERVCGVEDCERKPRRTNGQVDMVVCRKHCMSTVYCPVVGCQELVEKDVSFYPVLEELVPGCRIHLHSLNYQVDLDHLEWVIINPTEKTDMEEITTHFQSCGNGMSLK